MQFVSPMRWVVKYTQSTRFGFHWLHRATKPLGSGSLSHPSLPVEPFWPTFISWSIIHRTRGNWLRKGQREGVSIVRTWLPALLHLFFGLQNDLVALVHVPAWGRQVDLELDVLRIERTAAQPFLHLSPHIGPHVLGLK